ncbi:MAG: flagellar motor switch protein FliM [Nitrospinota bacterium]|nr:MAG: flagellar motor switch protein FliM [Nitrospinota bacterium]
MEQILSQEEVDALLQGISGGEIETEPDEKQDPSGVRPYDLTNQERIIRGRMPTLEIINQKFARLFRATLSATLRRVIDVSSQTPEMSKFGEFLKTVPVPTSMHVFRMPPLRGAALLIIESRLAFALIDSIFGGPGTGNIKIEGRDFTAIESRMIQKIVELLFRDLEKAWEPVEPIQIELERSEVNPQFVGIVPSSDVVVVIEFTVEMDQCIGAITLCIPYSTLEPIREKLYASFQSERLELDDSWLKRIIDRLLDVKVELSVELGSTEISSGALLSLQVGDIIRLDQDCNSELTVYVEGIPKFRGLPRMVKEKKAIQITHCIKRRGED